MNVATLSRFLNLDLVLKSPSDLGPLIAQMDQGVFVLHHEEHDRQFLLVLEINDENCKDPASCTQQFLTLIESFPEAARRLWTSCTSRSFSYGFEGGSDFPALDTTLSADLLLRMAHLGVDIGITVYPYRAEDGATGASTS
ncbi:hypothetical protein [Bradyrhizobium sp. SZCCHNRI1058]|uniref:hypothetical protein n=1 Tax=Bradyrhizobium TaxID=374 RepID=UPI002915D8BC|nr:hypothetical protein [Bradyrhizobium sp. SZCCHNRI1058]